MALLFTWPEWSATFSITATYGYLRDLQLSELTAMPSFHWKSISFNTTAQISCEKPLPWTNTQFLSSVFYLFQCRSQYKEKASLLLVGKNWPNGSEENKGDKQNQKTSGVKQNVKQRNLNVHQMYNRRCGKWLFVTGLISSPLPGTLNALEHF